jgi:predicted dehydrogenase
MNLNQQSDGAMWTLHRNLMSALSPIVDCGVHYIDVMCQMTRSKPVQVYAIGARLTEKSLPEIIITDSCKSVLRMVLWDGMKQAGGQ